MTTISVAAEEICLEAMQGLEDLPNEVAIQAAAIFWAIPVCLLISQSAADRQDSTQFSNIAASACIEFPTFVAAELGIILDDDLDAHAGKVDAIMWEKILRVRKALGEGDGISRNALGLARAIAVEDPLLTERLRGKELSADNADIFKSLLLCVSESLKGR